MLWVASVAFALAACPSSLLAGGPRAENGKGKPDGRGHHLEIIQARVVATGIPGAGAITEIGFFHPGGPIHDKPSFALSTQPGAMLDPKRLLVASSSNFGAPLARPEEAPGAILSLDVGGSVVNVPPDFALSGGQASALAGAVQLYAAQSPAFLNGLQNPGAVTHDLPSVSLPMGISLNNAFGRPWFANVPVGSDGDGTVSVTDPNGIPLAGAPDRVAGGVFAGRLTDRNEATTQGITAGALATTMLTKSPDGGGRAVFVAALADGSVVQIHVEKGVDALAPPGTFSPIPNITTATAESADPRTVTRVGIAFNWVPTFNLFITDPLEDRIVILDLTDDGTMFSATRRQFTSRDFDVPVDVAPAVREVAAHNFSCNTMLGGGSDLYVLNRGNNTILRLALDGTVLAVRAIKAGVPGFRVNGLAVSSDGQKLWVTATAPGRQGVVLELPAFGAGEITPSLVAAAQAAGATDVTSIGADLFSRDLVPDQGLGPLFNGQSCNTCHSSPAPGGMGLDPSQGIVLAGRAKKSADFKMPEDGGPVRFRSVEEFGSDACGLPTGVPRNANVTSLRSAMTLRGNGLIDAIADRDILANQALQPADMRGRPNVLEDGRIGKFGWKAQVATLVEFMGKAYRDEIGLTSPLRPEDLIHGCKATSRRPEVDALPLQAVAAFLNTIDPPEPSLACLSSDGAQIFSTLGCAVCHTPSLPRPLIKPVRLYSDLLLHDMGPELADRFEQGSATGREWRTMPLWRLSERGLFLHDGRATTVADAIAAHGGQAAASRDAFLGLDAASQQALLDFLGCL